MVAVVFTVHWVYLQELVASLADECDASQIPSNYGGSARTPLYESKIEVEMRAFIQNLGQSGSE